MGTTYDSPESVIGIYRPGLSSPARLLGTTIGREEILEELLERLERQAGKKRKQHFVFIGPRGIGKTHLLWLLEARMREAETLAPLYTIIRFPEENHRLLSFADFMLGVVEILGDVTGDSSWTELHRGLEDVEDDSRITDVILPRIKKYRRETGKNLLILLENLDSIFSVQLRNEKSIHQFRKFLMESSSSVFIGTSPVHFPGFDDVRHPLYDFFDIQTLEELSENETLEMIRVNLEWDGKDNLLDMFDELIPKIKALHEMTGGNPRLTMMLYNLISKENILEVRRQFELLLDQIAPFYQDRIRDLAPQERALLETMALMRDGMKTPAGIAKKLRKSPQQASSLLKRMMNGGHLTVSAHPTDKRSKVYRIKEGFFDLWLAMSQSRVQRKRLPYLVEFFSGWYALKSEKKRNHVYEPLEMVEDPEASSVFESLERMHGYLGEIEPDDDKAQSKFELALFDLERRAAGGAKQLHKEINEIPRQKPTLIWMKDRPGGWVTDGAEPDIIKQTEGLIECWRLQRTGDLEKRAALAAEIGADFSAMGLHELNVSFLREELKDITDNARRLLICTEMAKSQEMCGHRRAALATYGGVLKSPEINEDLHLKSTVINRTGKIYLNLGEYSEAKKCFDQSLQICRSIDNKYVEGITLNNISHIYSARGDFDKALKYMEKSLSISQEIENRSGEGATLNNISHIYFIRGDYKTALVYLEKSLTISQEIGDKSVEVMALNNIAAAAHTRGDYEKAFTHIEKSLKISEEVGDKAGEIPMLHNMAQIVGRDDDVRKYFEYENKAYHLALETGDAMGIYHAGRDLGQFLYSAGMKEEGIEILKKSLEIGQHAQFLDIEHLEKKLTEIGVL